MKTGKQSPRLFLPARRLRKLLFRCAPGTSVLWALCCANPASLTKSPPPPTKTESAEAGEVVEPSPRARRMYDPSRPPMGQAAPEKTPHAPAPPLPPRQQAPAHRAGKEALDYTIRVGIGFREGEVEILKQAASLWKDATGLPIHLRRGYGPMGSFHIAEEIPVCGQRWVYDGFLGCYNPSADSVVLNRHGIELESVEGDELLFVVFVHEIGHWLGLPHAADGEDSIMLPDYPRLQARTGEHLSLSPLDVRRACAINHCPSSPQ